MHLYFQEPFWIPCEIYNRDELHSYLVPLSWTGGKVPQCSVTGTKFTSFPSWDCDESPLPRVGGSNAGRGRNPG